MAWSTNKHSLPCYEISKSPRSQHLSVILSSF
jgi:hypothetical protein